VKERRTGPAAAPTPNRGQRKAEVRSRFLFGKVNRRETPNRLERYVGVNVGGPEFNLSGSESGIPLGICAVQLYTNSSTVAK
jgi:hypothetical protein